MKNSFVVKMAFGFVFFGCNNLQEKKPPLKVAISPYQDLAMLVNISSLGLDKRYQTDIDIQTMNWENILPAIASAGKSIDIGFGSLAEFLTKENNINKGSNDPVVFIYPAYIFKGGGFITFKKDLLVLDSNAISKKDPSTQFLSSKIGAQKGSVYDMMIFSLARRHNIPISSLKTYNTTLNEGILAARNGSLDITSAGLTQITEAQKTGGRLVLTMEDMGFADITGFICKESTLKERKSDIENLLRMWFDCVNYVMADLDNHSKVSLNYLDQKAATKYTLEQYKTALSQEYFPSSVAEANNVMVSKNGLFNYKKISSDIAAYLLNEKLIEQTPKMPKFIELK